MATAQTAKKSSAPRVASMRPDNMVSGGLPTDFDGTVTEVRLCPWDYGKQDQEHVLAVRVTIQPDEGQDIAGIDEGDPVVQHYSCGKLEDFVPSQDGENPVDLEAEDITDMEGYYALPVGKKEALNKNTNWAHFVQAAIDAGFDIDKIDADVRCFEGTHGHFNRIPQKQRPGVNQGVAAEGQQQRQREILVLTEVHEDKPKAKVGAKAAAAKKATPKAEEAEEAPATNGSGELNDRVTAAVLEVLGENDGTVAKSDLGKLVAKKLAPADKAKGLKLLNDNAFLESAESFVYDADEGTVTAI